MNFPVQCLMISGPQIDNGIRTAMYLSACKLIRERGTSVNFLDENGEGVVSTKHQHRSITSFMRGIEFEAVVEHMEGTTRCRFLVNDVDIPDEETVLSNCTWLPVVPFLVPKE